MRDFKYENTYLQCCSGMEAEAAGKLGRDLTDVEVAAIRNPSTLMMQESIGMAIYYATDPAKLAASLEEAGVAFESRRAEYCKSAVGILEEQIGRSLYTREKEAVERSRFVSDVMQLMIDLESADAGEKEAALANIIGATNKGKQGVAPNAPNA